jgi:5'-nucleotidase / UDP-sugar diphosphatase
VVDRLKGGSGKDIVWIPSWRYETTAGVPPEPRTRRIVDRWNAALEEQLAVPVGQTLVALDTRYGSLRSGETNFGNLVADALRNATGADVALTNSGSIRGDRLYPPGTVLTYGDILRELPFGNVVVVIEVTGADLLSARDHGVSQVQDLGPAFPQVSGLRLVFEPARQQGPRVDSVEIDGAPLDPGATYRVATTDYLRGGGDGYASLRNGRALVDASAGRLLASTVMNYLTALGGEVAPRTDGRVARAG